MSQNVAKCLIFRTWEVLGAAFQRTCGRVVGCYLQYTLVNKGDANKHIHILELKMKKQKLKMGSVYILVACILRVLILFFCGKEKYPKESRREKKLHFSRWVLLWAIVLLRCRAEDGC